MTRTDISEVGLAVGAWGKIRAFAKVTMQNGMTLDGVKVIEGSNGLFVGMPSVSKKNKDSGEMEWQDCVFIKDQEDRDIFQEVILGAYHNKIGEQGSSSDTADDQGSYFE